MKILYIIFLIFIYNQNSIFAVESDCNYPSYFIYFDDFSGEGGGGPRYLITSKNIEYPLNHFDEFIRFYTIQIVIDTSCLKSIKKFILEFKKLDFFESKLHYDGNHYFFSEVNNCIDCPLFYISNSKYAYIFFNHLKKYLEENEFNIKELNDLINENIRSLKLYNDKKVKEK